MVENILSRIEKIAAERNDVFYEAQDKPSSLHLRNLEDTDVRLMDWMGIARVAEITEIDILRCILSATENALRQNVLNTLSWSVNEDSLQLIEKEFKLGETTTSSSSSHG